MVSEIKLAPAKVQSYKQTTIVTEGDGTEKNKKKIKIREDKGASFLTQTYSKPFSCWSRTENNSCER